MSDDNLAKFNMAVSNAQRRWEQQNRNYGTAYSRAFHNYNELLKKQIAADKAASERKAQLVMLALSLAGGSILGALFAKSAAKSVAGEMAKNAALDMIVKRNMTKTFSALAWADGSVSAKFVMGKIWDDVGKRVTSSLQKQITGIAAGVTIPTGTVGSKPTPLEYQNNLMNMTSRIASTVSNTGLWLYESHGGDAGLSRLIQSSPFFKAKSHAIDVDKAAKKIEMSFWMKFVLDQDYLQHGTKQMGKFTTHKVPGRTFDISQSPSAKNYPSSTQSARDYSDVKYKSVGSIISKRINKLYKGLGLGTGNFMGANDGFFDSQNVSLQLLKSAEAALEELAKQNRLAIRGSV